MYELQVTVSKVMGTCTASPPMTPGDSFSVRDGTIRIPDGGYVCLWALHSLLPVIALKEREFAEATDADWVWRVHHVQCPDPDGRVVFRIERTGKLGEGEQENLPGSRLDERGHVESDQVSTGGLRSLRVVVDEVRGKCTSGMQPGDHVVLHSGRLYIPAGHCFCLYALQAVLPFLPAKQRPLGQDDWLASADCVICPDPAGNVVLRIEPCG